MTTGDRDQQSALDMLLPAHVDEIGFVATGDLEQRVQIDRV